MIYKHLRFDSSWRWSYPKLYFSGLLFLLHTHDVSCPFIKADLIYLVFYLSQWWFHLLIKESIQVCCKVQQLYWWWFVIVDPPTCGVYLMATVWWPSDRRRGSSTMWNSIYFLERSAKAYIIWTYLLLSTYYTWRTGGCLVAIVAIHITNYSQITICTILLWIRFR